MTRFPIVKESESPKELADVFADFRSRMGFAAAPNFILAQGGSPSVVNGTWGVVRHVLVEGELPRSLKEMMFVAISMDRDCKYCESAHLACCRMLGVDDKTLSTLVRSIDDMMPEKSRDIIQFGIKCARDPQSLNDDDFAVLKAHGLNHSQTTEVIAMSALAVYAITMAEAMQLDADEMFFA